MIYLGEYIQVLDQVLVWLVAVPLALPGCPPELNLKRCISAAKAKRYSICNQIISPLCDLACQYCTLSSEPLYIANTFSFHSGFQGFDAGS